MAKQPGMGDMNTRSRVQLRFLDGGQHDSECFSELMEEQDDGALSSVRTTRAEEAADGEILVPISRPQDPLVACRGCGNPGWSLFRRERPSHGILRKRNAHQCSCGQYFCPRHAVKGHDGAWRCRACARRAAIAGFFRAIFLKTER